MRVCPRDGTDLRTERWKSAHGPVDVDICSTCHGLFLDDGEIRTLTGNRRLDHLLHKHPAVALGGELVCPNCKGIMEGQYAGSAQVDVCFKCFGVWLDGGELERIQGMEKGELRQLTPSELERFLQSEDPDPKMREAAVNSMLTQWLVHNWNAARLYRGG